MLNLKQINKILSLTLIVLSIVVGFEILFYHRVITNWLSDVVTNAGVWSWVVLGIVQFLQVVLIPMPATFITLISMKMYPDNLYLLFAITLAVIMLGVATSYWIGRKWGKKAVIWCAGSEEEYEKWLGVLKSKKTNLIYLVTILFPIFPDDILCLIAGSIKMNFWWYFVANLVGRAIGLVTFMFVFKAISNSIWSIIVMIALLVALVVIKIIVKRRLTRESCDNR
jgi:uncharacterized membrane protein YdjX (TVP38/TMEM64 family)